MSRKIKLIFNPTANMRRAWPIAALLQPIVQEQGGGDWTGTVYPTHAAELAQRAAQDGYELIIALGGDGTVHEVVNGLMRLPAGQRPTLGIVPIGSGNDFASSLGISSHPETALRQVFTGQPRLIDIGLIQDEHGRSEYWTNTLGIGFDAIIDIHAKRLTRLQGFSMYLVAALQAILLNYTTFSFQANLDGESWQDTLLMLIIANGKREGGGFRVAPQASCEDGLLDFIGIRPIDRPRMLHTLTQFIRGNAHKLPYSVHGNLGHLELHSKQPLIIHFDGEIFAGLGSQTHQITVQAVPSALSMIIPALL
jgi:YegS/Rv2252/BmrU family lipid kinase